jgi:NAD(P)-dependent dehydrogenase (short-subunit alcohol dehydrogenase family)
VPVCADTLNNTQQQHSTLSTQRSSTRLIAIPWRCRGSIGDNTSGGIYAYRASKAAVNMVAKGMSVDLKEKGIAVVAVNPGLVLTEFGPGYAAHHPRTERTTS